MSIDPRRLSAACSRETIMESGMRNKDKRNDHLVFFILLICHFCDKIPHDGNTNKISRISFNLIRMSRE